MEESLFSTLKDAMQSITADNSNQIIIKYNYNAFKEFCFSSCSNSIQTEQFNTTFAILSSKDHETLRRGLTYKSQIRSIGLSFESLSINRVKDKFYYILWNSNLVALPDLDTEEGSRRESRGRERESSDANLRDVRPRQLSNTRNISSSSSSSSSSSNSSSSSSNDNDNDNSNNGIQNNNENEMNNENNENENNENNENYDNNNNDNELEIRRPRRQHRVPSRFQLTQSPIQIRNHQRNFNILKDNRGVTNANDRNLNALEIENAVSMQQSHQGKMYMQKILLSSKIL
jgi:hypothetical protein